MYRPIATSIGIEIEAKSLSRSLVRTMLRNAGIQCSVIQDGSVRNYAPTIFGLPFITADNDTRNILRGLNTSRMDTELGCEVVSPIILTSTPGWEKYVFSVLDLLQNLGEGIASQTSIHIHVNAEGLPVDALHHIIKIWKSIEAGIFRISCGPLGYFRGDVHKDSHYCRPLIKKGPLVMRNSDGGFRPSYDVDCLLKTNSVEEFAQALGRSDDYGGQRYHTPRYAALCFHSLFRLGSIELRTFNFTHNTRHVLAYIEVAKSLVRASMDKFIDELPEYPHGSNDMPFSTLLDGLQVQDNQLAYTLEELWNMGQFANPIKGWRQTHLAQDGFRWGNIRRALIPDRIQNEEIHPSDSHKAENSEYLPGSIDLELLGQVIRLYNRR